MTTGCYDAETHDLLVRAVPAPDDAPYKDWDAVVELATRARKVGHRVHRRDAIGLLTRRRLLVPVLAAVVLAAVVGISVAAGAFDFFQPPEQQIIAGSAHEVLSYRTSFGREVTGWAGSTPDGRTCAFFQFDDQSLASPPSFHPDTDSLGQACPNDSTARGGGLIEWWPLSDGNYSVLLLGLAAPSSGIVRFAIDGPNGALTTIASTNGVYVGELPSVTSHGEMPAGSSYSLVGYDAAGNIVSRQNLNQTVADATPSATSNGS